MRVVPEPGLRLVGEQLVLVIMQNGEDFLRAFIEYFLEVVNFFSVISRLIIHEGHQIFSDVREPVSMFLQFLKPVINSIL